MKQTAPLRKNSEFKRLYARGKSASNACLAGYCRLNRRGESRLGVTVGGKLGNAVKRNRVRRRLKELYRLNEPAVKKGYDLVLVARVRAGEATFGELRRAFFALLSSLGMLEEGQ